MKEIEQQIKSLRDELRQHNHNYYVLDEPSISDYDFDLKLKELQELEAKLGSGQAVHQEVHALHRH